jgi:DNA-binding NarL/FixJ family response regulator
MNSIKIAVAEDHPSALRAVVRLLSGFTEFSVVLAVANGKELIENFYQTKPDIVLLDIRMPVMDGHEAARILLQKYPDVKIIAWTLFEETDEVISMYKIGVRSFIGKKEADIYNAIKTVATGAYYFPHKIGKMIEQHLTAAKPICPVTFDNFERLLLNSIVMGESSAQIGLKLNRSPRTIEDYRNKLYEKCGVANKEQLIAFAVKWELVNQFSS